ncbi:MAG: hypothetical protein HZY79_06300 [Rhodoblastus sp.]|nr:MAG: hypothetical protein HZY79_06300 [Rhodoblastus sp.]
MPIARYGRVLQFLTAAYDEALADHERDWAREVELAQYFIRMAIDATQHVVESKLGFREPHRHLCTCDRTSETARDESEDSLYSQIQPQSSN